MTLNEYAAEFMTAKAESNGSQTGKLDNESLYVFDATVLQRNRQFAGL